MTTKWIAGWNIPGCLPDMEPAEFDTEQEAIDWLISEYELLVEQFGPYPHDYNYWVEPAQ
jgi:hypothetical protein